MKTLFQSLFFVFLIFITSQNAFSQNFCAVVEEVFQNEHNLEQFKGKEKEKLWIGGNYESSIEIPDALSTYINVTATTSLVAILFDGVDIKAADSKFELEKKRIGDCLQGFTKYEQTKSNADNVSFTQEIVFTRKGKQTHTVVLQYWKTRPSGDKKKDKKLKARMMLIFPQNGFYL